MNPLINTRILFFFIVIISLCVYFPYLNLQQKVDIEGESILFDINQGDSFGKILINLKEKNIISNTNWIYLYIRLFNKSNQIKAGEYLILKEDSHLDIIDQFISGKVYLHPFTIIEGWTLTDLNDAILNSSFIMKGNKSLEHNKFTDKFHLDSSEITSEGLFLPETYFIAKGTTPEMLYYMAHKMLIEELNDQWDNRAPNLPLKSPYEALILASIIEKETAVDDERPKISSVFIERLKINMRLQTDPTVIYGLGKDFNGNLTRKDLRTDTIYNTYTRYGLPPTPISFPGRNSISAALNPSNEKNIYFVATGDKDGRHKFSQTKDEHDLAVSEYLVKIKANSSRKKNVK